MTSFARRLILSTLQASMSAPSIPRCQFSSLARLDQDRVSAMLADELGYLSLANASERFPVVSQVVKKFFRSLLGPASWHGRESILGTAEV